MSASKVAQNLQRFRIAVAAHDRENPDHSPARGIGMHPFDLERLGFDDGEELWSGIHVEADSGVTGNFRVLCDGNHADEEQAAAEEKREVAHAVGIEVPS